MEGRCKKKKKRRRDVCRCRPTGLACLTVRALRMENQILTLTEVIYYTSFLEFTQNEAVVQIITCLKDN